VMKRRKGKRRPNQSQGCLVGTAGRWIWATSWTTPPRMAECAGTVWSTCLCCIGYPLCAKVRAVRVNYYVRMIGSQIYPGHGTKTVSPATESKESLSLKCNARLGSLCHSTSRKSRACIANNEPRSYCQHATLPSRFISIKSFSLTFVSHTIHCSAFRTSESVHVLHTTCPHGFATDIWLAFPVRYLTPHVQIRSMLFESAFLHDGHIAWRLDSEAFTSECS
jgi:hypothetical protein